jgi:hypothetical protein
MPFAHARRMLLPDPPSFIALAFAGCLSLGCGASSDGSDEVSSSASWPEQWSAEIAWSDYTGGSKSNTWTGTVHFDWTLRAMRVDVTPPEPGAPPGPPIAEAGSMLMREGAAYFVTQAGACEPMPLGTPRPSWLLESGAVQVGVEDGEAVWEVKLAELDDELDGCFYYSMSAATKTPRFFGGNPDCSGWQEGSFVEYANYEARSAPESLFEVPANCPSVPTSAQGQNAACTGCHDGG